MPHCAVGHVFDVMSVFVTSGVSGTLWGQCADVQVPAQGGGRDRTSPCVLSCRLKPFVVLTDTHRYKVFWQDRRKLWCTDVLDRGAAWSLIKAMLAQIRVEGGEAKVLTLPESDRQVLPPLWRAGVGLPGPAHGDVANLEDLEGLLPD